MNWQKIQKKFKKAYKEYLMWRGSWGNKLPFDYTFQTRDLYDFFDQNGIKLFVSLADNFSEFQQGNTTPERRFIIWGEKVFDSRVDAEYKAFEKGFELLDRKLKK